MKANSSVKLYVFKGVNSQGKVAKGFACKCVKDASSNETSWQGKAENNCGGGVYFDQAIELSLVGEGSAPPPANACCRNKPRVGDKVLIDKSDLNCF